MNVERPTSLEGQATGASARGRRGWRFNVGRSPFSSLLAHLTLILVCFLFLLPLAWMISTSLKPLEDTIEYPPRFIPRHVQWSNYRDVFSRDNANFALYARNTLIVAMLSVAGTLLSSSLAAYAFARIPFRGRGVLFAITLATMMVPFPVIMVPSFAIFRWIGEHTPLQMLGTLRPLWLPMWLGNAFNIFLLRQFFRTIPQELSDAARIDGCSELGIYWRIVLPLSKPALSVVALFTFLYAWNDFLGPLVYIQRPSQFTLALGLQTFQSQSGTQWHLLMAATAVVIAPVVILFILAQRTFIEGIATTGLKA
jgi:multiple sugar transport system permease protein